MPSIVRRVTLYNLDRLVPRFDVYRQFYGQQSDIIVARKFLSDRLSRNGSVVPVADNGGGAVIGFVQLYPTFSSILTEPMYLLSWS